MHGGSTWAEEAPLDFSDNSNPLGPPAGFWEALREAVERGVHRRFPAHLAEEVLSQYEGLPVTLFNGATEALIYALLELRPRRVLTVWPTYGDYQRVAELLGVPLRRPRDWVVDTARRLEARGARLLVDESFIDFARGESAAPDVAVVKSYGKFLAAPGLRVGALLFKPSRPPPWRINSFADYALWRLGPEALRRHREKTLGYIAEEKPRVVNKLRRCAPVAPSWVHFHIVFSDPPPGVKVRPLWDKGVRGFRFSLRTPAENNVLVHAVCRHVR